MVISGKSEINKTVKIGLFATGNEAYWPQFDGLLTRLLGYAKTIETKLTHENVRVINLGMVDTPRKAFQAGQTFRQQEVNIVFLFISTYALSSTILPVVKKLHVPVIILNLSPEAKIDFQQFNQMKNRTRMTGEWLAFCQACSVPEIANVFNRTGIPYYLITGTIDDDPEAWKEIEEWVEATRVSEIVYHNCLGLMGHYYSGMLDIYSDITQQHAYFGGYTEMIEVDELTSLRRDVPEKEIKNRLKLFDETFEITQECNRNDLMEAARTSLALERIVEKYRLGSLAYYYKGTGNKDNENTISSIILGNSLLTGSGIPVAGEYEIKNVQAMKIMDCFRAGGSFTEFYAMDYEEDIVLMGHDGPGHIGIAEGKTKVRPLDVYHGKVGRGLSVEMQVKKGPVSLLSVVQTRDGKLKLLTAEGESVPGPILEIGNTNSRYKFSIGAREFVNRWSLEGPAHHCAVGIGHISSKIDKLGNILGMEVVKIC
jgi:L-arabinose isomerase